MSTPQSKGVLPNGSTPNVSLKNSTTTNSSTNASAQLNEKKQETATQHKVSDYPWEHIGSFNEGKKFDSTFIRDSNLIKTYVAETFHADWYWNTVLVIGTCFFSWLVARWRFGIFGLVFVLLCTASVYKAEFRRFKRNVRDDLQRIASAEHLEQNPETMQWMNNFLKKFWVIYMPALSDTVKTQTNAVLKDMAPGFGIDALTLDEFTLGSKAPSVNSIKSYTKKGADTVEMDWAFSFTPNDTADMTKRDIAKKINPKVALGVRIGKAFVSKNLPILVEDMSVAGRMRVTLKFSLNFPHIKMVSISMLEPPKIDFSLKPVGGDTLGLDIMTFIPGLSTLINTLINSNAGPMLYAPNHLDIDVEEIMAAQSNDAIGVVALSIKGADELQENVNPYVQIFTDNNSSEILSTEVRANTTSPRWNDTKYILVNKLQQKLNIDLYDFSTTKKKGLLYGTHDFDLSELLQKDSHLNIQKPLLAAGKKKGFINYDIRWFPVLTNKKVANTDSDAQDIDADSSEVGIFKFKLHQAKGLDNTISITGKLSPKAELFIDGELVKTFRTLKRANEPSWEESTELLISHKSTSEIKLVITDTSSRKEVIGSLEDGLESLVSAITNGNDVFPLDTQGDVRVTAAWNPVSLTGVDSNAKFIPPIGVMRLHIRNAKDLVNLETVGNVDPYVKVLLNNRKKYTTAFHPDTLTPTFNEVIFLPITSDRENVSLELWDDQNLGKDRPLGSTTFPISKYIKKNADGSLAFYDGSNKIVSAVVQRKNKKPKGEIFFSVSFLPAIPVYSAAELESLKQREADLAAKKVEDEEQLKEWNELYKKSPKEYEWVEVEDKEDAEAEFSKKEKMSLEQLLTYQAGTLGIHISGGTVKKNNSYFQILFDDYAEPAFTSSKTAGRSVNAEVGEAFIRDLPNSKLIIRTTKKAIVKDSDQIIEDASFHTIDLLKKGFNKPTTVAVGASQISLMFEYIPSSVQLQSSETILDTGRAKVEFLDGDNLAPADRNGKSDPFVTLSFGEVELFKSSVVKKTLSPTWNEGTTVPITSRSRPTIDLKVWDWDRAGANEVIGEAPFNISSVTPGAPDIITFKLKPQGTVRAKITFIPEYIRPKVGAAEFGLGLSALAGAPLKTVDAAATLATGVVGGSVGVVGGVATGVGGVATGAVGSAVGGVTKGGSLFKSVLGGKKSRTSVDKPRSSTDNYSSDVQSLRSGKSKQQLGEPVIPPPKIANNGVSNSSPLASPKVGHSRSVSTASSTFSSVAKGKRSTTGQLIIRSGSNLGSHAQLKVSLAINGKLKEIYQTKNVKSSSGTIRWDEETNFDAPPEAEIVFGGVVHHTFSKDQELGNASIKLYEVIDSPRDIELDLGQGKVLVSFRYSPELAE